MKHRIKDLPEYREQRGKGAVVSPEIETVEKMMKIRHRYRVARERWSRLRLKQSKSRILMVRKCRGKGAVVSPEIETCEFHRNILLNFAWQGSGGLA